MTTTSSDKLLCPPSLSLSLSFFSLYRDHEEAIFIRLETGQQTNNREGGGTEEGGGREREEYSYLHLGINQFSFLRKTSFEKEMKARSVPLSLSLSLLYIGYVASKRPTLTSHHTSSLSVSLSRSLSLVVSRFSILDRGPYVAVDLIPSDILDLTKRHVPLVIGGEKKTVQMFMYSYCTREVENNLYSYSYSPIWNFSVLVLVLADFEF